ncbi:MAG: hypothetical protein Q8J84_08285 [Flavobacteriaceae bacterium]|nr:hypothetical protein [Flavobacteriaceae bacterium]
MKKLLVLLIGLGFISCGGSGGDDPPPPKDNKAPSIPSLVYPTNNLLCVQNTLEFSWTSSVDPEGDNITYEIVIAKDNLFTQIIEQKTTAALTAVISLDKGVAYYWKVKATDSKGKSSEFTANWNFFTEGVGIVNYVPFAAGIIKPTMNSTIAGTTTILEWTASDVDNDPLTYDIYFGTAASPPLLISNQTLKTYTVNLTANTTYYWRIDVKDNKGGKTIGQVWSFKTS